jgi:hypothetical protein
MQAIRMLPSVIGSPGHACWCSAAFAAYIVLVVIFAGLLLVH